MGDFVGKEEIKQIRTHYRTYMAAGALKNGDNKAVPASYDATTFRDVSSWYINRLLRYIEVAEIIDDVMADSLIADIRDIVEHPSHSSCACITTLRELLLKNKRER